MVIKFFEVIFLFSISFFGGYYFLEFINRLKRNNHKK